MIDTRNNDIVSRYFDEVQNEIKRLISEDNDFSSNQIDIFNKEIFNQPDDIMSEIQNYIDKASSNNLDIKKVAKIIYDRFKLQIKNNIFNQTDNQNVPNHLLGERNHIMTFEKFKMFENKDSNKVEIYISDIYNQEKIKYDKNYLNNEHRIVINKLEELFLNKYVSFITPDNIIKNGTVVDIMFDNEYINKLVYFKLNDQFFNVDIDYPVTIDLIKTDSQIYNL